MKFLRRLFRKSAGLEVDGRAYNTYGWGIPKTSWVRENRKHNN